MKEIQLTQGKVAIVDDEDYEYLSQWKWHARESRYTWYAARHDGNKMISMHRAITGAPSGLLVDHKDGDGLHNWRGNLRVCTLTQNGQNRRRQKNSTSGYKGVSLTRENGVWGSRISVNKQEIFLGSFDSAEDAAIAYNHAALEYFGEFASFNDIPDWQSRTPIRREQYQNTPEGASSKYRGVRWRHSAWNAEIKVGGRSIYLGSFSSEIEAAKAWDDAARKLRGETTRTNF
jgi:hypothetical protein